MTIRNLDALFAPKVIALVGASNEPNSVGAVLVRNLFGGGFRGPILTVNPREEAIGSTLNYKSVGDLPLPPDLAVVATPAAAVPGIIADLGARGCRAAIVIAAGFGEGDRAEGRALRQRMLDAAKPHLLRVVGPNCLGFISPPAGINASFAHLTPPAGDIAFVTQSGAIATAILDWASSRGAGFSHVASLGDMSDVDFGDLLDYLALDRATKAILLYVESVTQARKFMSAGRIAARTKPVVIVKAGRSAAGAKAALSHTGALAGSDVVYDAAFRRAGMLRVRHLRELFEAVTTLSAGLRTAGDRLAVLTNGGGAGVLAVDALDDEGGALAQLSRQTIAGLDRILPTHWSRSNPVDILGDAPGRRYADALTVLAEDRAADAIFAVNCPTAVADSLEAARALADAHASAARRVPLLTCWLGDEGAAPSRRLFAARRIPTYETPEEAVRGLMHLVQFSRNQELLLETPPAVPREAGDERPDEASVLIEKAVADGRTLMSEVESKQLLDCYGIPVVKTLSVANAREAAEAARALGKPVALKILSPDITHKSDAGGVALDLASPEAVEKAAEIMVESVSRHVPGARLAGFTVQEMAAARLELILGIAEDATFGPVLLFGHGGTATEVVADRAIGLPPLNMVLARAMIARTRVAKLLAGYRNEPPADIDAIALTLVRLSEIAARHPAVAELDINPLLAGPEGVVALDARIVLRERGAPAPRLAIEPYPADLEHEIEIDAGERLLLRPIRAEDEPRLTDMVLRSSSEDIRMRFLGHLKDFPHHLAARLSQIDYDREMALIAVERGEGGEGDIRGIVRLAATPEFDDAEFAIMVRSDMKGRGLGFRLMQEIMSYARRRGVRTLHGDVLAENTAMLRMAAELGFTRSPVEGGVVRVTLVL